MFRPSTVEQILSRLAHQRPVPTRVIRAQVRLRWWTTGAIALLLPCALAMIVWGHSWAWQVPGISILAFALAGLIALGVAYAANRREGVEAQWGLAPLTVRQMEEFVNLAARHLAIDQVVSDAWLETFVRAGSDLRGRDLILLRKSVRQYEQAIGEKPVSAPVEVN